MSIRERERKLVFFLALSVLLVIDLPSGGPSVKRGVHTLTQMGPEFKKSFKIFLKSTNLNTHPVTMYNARKFRATSIANMFEEVIEI